MLKFSSAILLEVRDTARRLIAVNFRHEGQLKCLKRIRLLQLHGFEENYSSSWCSSSCSAPLIHHSKRFSSNTAKDSENHSRNSADKSGTAVSSAKNSSSLNTSHSDGSKEASSPSLTAKETRKGECGKKGKFRSRGRPAPVFRLSVDKNLRGADSKSGSVTKDAAAPTQLAGGAGAGGPRKKDAKDELHRGKGASSERKSNSVAVLRKGLLNIPSRRLKSKKNLLRKKKFSVCVLSSSYKGTDSETAELDNFVCTPAHYIKRENRKKYRFTNVEIEKKDAYRTVRELVNSHKYDLFFNLCDGGRDEKRAGVEVVAALEELNAAFTGMDSRRFEPSKIDMKMLVRSSGVRVPNYVLVRKVDGLSRRCQHLQFPVIVKHVTGYASIGIQKDNLCHTIDQLRVKARAFIARYHHALIEEFIAGREGTVLTTADPLSPHGIKVFRPLMFTFLQGPNDFAYFEKKWKLSMNSKTQMFLPPTDPAYDKIIDMARNAFHYILNGVGYGRVDFRIDDKTNEPVFLEINPNCGMWYHEKDGGDYADIMVAGDTQWTHERFFNSAVRQAVKQREVRRPWYLVSQDKNGVFTARSIRNVPANHCLFGDMEDPVPVIAKALFPLEGSQQSSAHHQSVGCVVLRGDGRPTIAVTIRHSCEPNMQFIHGRTLMCATKRPISTGEELSIDYGTLRDESMPRFTCDCGTRKCRRVITSSFPTARVFDSKVAKRNILRERKKYWLNARRMRMIKVASGEKGRLASNGAGRGGAQGAGSGASSDNSAASSGSISATK